MTAYRERILRAAKGEMVDVLPYVPRIDLWYNANKRAGTLPKEHTERDIAAICRAEGWGAHHLVPLFLRNGQHTHRALGLYNLCEQPYTVEMGPSVEVETVIDGDFITNVYHTPKGDVRTKTMYSDEMRASGASITWVAEHVLKTPADYEVVAYIFENLVLKPNYEEFKNWLDTEVGENGIGAAFASLASSPMHHIQKEFLDATDFYYHYNDNAKPMARLAEGVGVFYDKIFQLIMESPAEAILWGANFDDMITYSTYFAKEIKPWLDKVGAGFKAKNQVCICHCDGENYGLMDVLPASGFHVAEAICPWPMTKVTIQEYYKRWHGRLTIFGGIPSNILLNDLTTDQDFEGYLDTMFRDVVPGTGLIVGIADTTPPQANWDRLRRIGDRVEKEGRLPLTAGAQVLVDVAGQSGDQKGITEPAKAAGGSPFSAICQMVLDGDDDNIQAETLKLLKEGHAPTDIMNKGLILAMDIISPQFRDGTVFIPEVLLAARAMNLAVETLEPYLAESGGLSEQKTIVLGTVFGDLHDIGKNMVATMLKGAGFKVIDLGINVPAAKFVEAIKEHKPELLGLSALLTTTMPEMTNAIASVVESGLRDKVKIMVGGAPINAKFANDIGADGYSADAGDAVILAKKLV